MSKTRTLAHMHGVLKFGKGHYVGIHELVQRLLLKTGTLRSIVDAGLEHPSEVQHESIPQAVLGRYYASGLSGDGRLCLKTLHQLNLAVAAAAAAVDGEAGGGC
jgi:ATP-dependent RNA helicase UAP56/SUB2